MAAEIEALKTNVAALGTAIVDLRARVDAIQSNQIAPADVQAAADAVGAATTAINQIAPATT